LTGFWFSAKLNLYVTFVFVPGKYNSHADLLSSIQVDSFRQTCQFAHLSPSTVSPEVWSLFIAP